MEPKRIPGVPAQWTREAAHEGRAHRHSKRKTVCSLTQSSVWSIILTCHSITMGARVSTESLHATFQHVFRKCFSFFVSPCLCVTCFLFTNAMPSLGKRCLLHYSMYLAGACLSLSLHVCVLHVSSSRNSRHTIRIPIFHTPFLPF